MAKGKDFVRQSIVKRENDSSDKTNTTTKSEDVLPETSQTNQTTNPSTQTTKGKAFVSNSIENRKNNQYTIDDYKAHSAEVKKNIATYLSDTNSGKATFDKDTARELAENYAATQFYIFDDNLKKGSTGIVPIGDNLSNLFKAHGYDFKTLFPDLYDTFSLQNIEGYAYGNSNAFKEKYDKRANYEMEKGALLDKAVATNQQREHERNAEKIAAEGKEKTAAYNAELERLNGEVDWNSLTPQERSRVVNENKIQAAKTTGYKGSGMSPEEAAERKEAKGAYARGVYADESLYAIRTMRDVIAKIGPAFFEGFIPELRDVTLEDGTVVRVSKEGFTEDQYKVYLYLLNNEGEEAAERFKDGIKNTRNSMKATATSQLFQEMEKGNYVQRFDAALGQARYALESGVEGIGQAFMGIGDTFTGDTEYFMPGVAQQTTAMNKEDATFAGRLFLGVGETLPQVLGTAAAGAVNPYLGMTFLGATAYGSSYVDAINSGATRGRAIGMGIASAALEIALERFVGKTIEGFGPSLFERVGKGIKTTSLGNAVSKTVSKFAVSHPKGAVVLSAFGRWLGNSSSEFVEEYLAETASPILRNIFIGENKDFTLWSDEQKEAGLIGFITGGILDGFRTTRSVSNILKGGTALNIEKLKLLPDEKILDEYMSRFTDADIALMLSKTDPSFNNLDGQGMMNAIDEARKQMRSEITPEEARKELIGEEMLVATVTSMEELGRKGMSYNEATKTLSKQNVDVNAYAEFAKAAYEMGVAQKESYSDVEAKAIELAKKGLTASEIADRIVDNNPDMTKEQAVRTANVAKNKIFADSVADMTVQQKSKALSERIEKENDAETAYLIDKYTLKSLEAAEAFELAEKAYNSSAVNSETVQTAKSLENQFETTLDVSIPKVKLSNVVLDAVVADGDVNARAITEALADAYGTSLSVSSNEYKELTSSGENITNALTNYAVDGTIPKGVKNKARFASIADAFKAVADSAVRQISTARTKLFGTTALNLNTVADTYVTPAETDAAETAEFVTPVEEIETFDETEEATEENTVDKEDDESSEKGESDLSNILSSLDEKYGKEKSIEIAQKAVEISQKAEVEAEDITGIDVNGKGFVTPVLKSLTVENDSNAKKVLADGVEVVFEGFDVTKSKQNAVTEAIYKLVEGERAKLFESKNSKKKVTKPLKKTNSEVKKTEVEKIAETVSDDNPIDDSIIDYTNSDVAGKINWNSLSKDQQRAIEFVKKIAKNFNLKLKLIPNGATLGINGAYTTGDTIILDIYAGIDNFGTIGNTIIQTMSHEMTHWMKTKAKALYDKISDKVFKALEKADGISMDQRIKNEMEERGLKYEDAKDEIIARACEDMLSRSSFGKQIYDSLTAPEKKTFKQMVLNFLGKAKESFNKTLSEYKSNSKEAALLRESGANLDELAKVWDEMLVESSGVEKADVLRETDVKENIATKKNSEAVPEAQKKLTEAVLDKVDLQIDYDSGSIAPKTQLSRRTWNESEYVHNEDVAAKAIVKAIGGAEAEATGAKNKKAVEQYISENRDRLEADARRYIKNINSIAKYIADNQERLDYEPNIDGMASVLKSNSEYKWTVDMSTLCAKRLITTGTFDAIQKAMPDKVFNSEDIVHLREMMLERGYEVACGICYVESTRRELGPITAEFIERYKESQRTGKPIQRINSEGKHVDLVKTKEQMETTKNKETDRFFADKNYTPTMADLNTTDIDLIKRDHPLVYEAYLNFMNARGQAKPKLLETRAEYKGEILRVFSNKNALNARNAAGGLRVQSFSDFEVAHLIDMMQIALDMSRVGLMSQAYTKVPAFADIFGGTGMKINLSLIAKGSGLDENGNLIFDDIEGMPHEEAFRLREKWSNNVGTILVGKNDAHIRAAMADTRIDFIIPFHKSSWKESLYEALGLEGYTDYTDWQNEKPEDPNRKIKNFQPSEYWDYSKTGEENAQEYLRRCEADHRTPKFERFKDEPGYWKLLIDFKMYNNDGVGSPQEVVKPEFDMDSAMKVMTEYEGGHRSLPVAKDVVDDFVKEYNETHFSMRKSVEETKDLIAVHNLKSSKLNEAIKLGGFPGISVAVTKADMGHTSYGDISVVLRKDTVDPAVDDRVKLYSGDAWTPTAPEPWYIFDKAEARKLEKEVDKFLKKHDLSDKYENIFSREYIAMEGLDPYHFKQSPVLEAMYLDSIGKLGEIDKDLSYGEHSHQLDLAVANDPQFYAWQEKILEPLVKDKKLAETVTKKGLFGNEIEKTKYIPYTAENIVEAMKKGKNVEFLHTAGIREYSSIDEAKSQSDLLGFAADYEKKSKKLEKSFSELVQELSTTDSELKKHSREIINIIKNNADFRTAKAAFKEHFDDVYTSALAAKFTRVYQEATNLPRRYFEAKLYKVTRFDEAAAIIVPDNLDTELKAKLGEKGANVVEYEHGNEQARLEALNSLEDVKFSRRITPEQDAEYLELAKDPVKNEAKLREMVDEAARKAGYDSPLLFHGTDAFGFTELKTSGVERFEWSPFFATNSEKTAGTYTSTPAQRGVSEQFDDERLQEIADSSIEEVESDIDDAIDRFCRKIDNYFSEWYFGYGGGQSDIRDIVDEYIGSSAKSTADSALYGDLEDVVEDAYHKYGDQYQSEYDDFLEWQLSEDADEFGDIIADIEALVDKRNGAEKWVETGGIYRLYANTDNLFEIDGGGTNWNNIRSEKLPPLSRNGVNNVPYKTRDVALWAKKNGYDGVVFRNIRDSGNKGVADVSDVYTFFKPESQVKSADPVTYDDNGNVIPLSERFNPQNDDIRYSERRKVSKKDIEKFDYSMYNEINLPKQEMARVQSEVLTWHADKRKQLISQTLSNGTTYHCVIDDEGVVHVYNAEPSTNIHERKNKYDNTDREQPDRFIEKLRAGQRYNGGDFDTGENGRKPSEINRDDNLSLRRGKRGRRAGYSKNAAYDNRKPKEYRFNEDGTGEVTYDDGTTTKFSERNRNKEINIDDYTLDELANLPDDKFNALYEALGLDAWFEQNDELLDDEDLSIDDISEELHVEPEKVEILIRREGLGNSHIDDGSMAVMTVDRINRDIADSGAKFNPGYARKYITRISPSDFIDLTVSRSNLDRENFDTKVEGDAGTKMGDIDYSSALKESEQTPYLVIDKDTGRVVGHNGRHRMRALEMAGIESAEIEVQFEDEDGRPIRYNAETIPVMAISSQTDTAIETRIRNIIPMNEAHRGEIEGLYGETAHEDAGIKYSERSDRIGDEMMKLLEEYGAIPKGENPFRDVSVPKKTEVNKRVSRTVRTVLEAEATPDEMIPTISELIEQGEFSYEAYTDKQALEDAEKRIKKSWSDSLTLWFQDVENGVVSKGQTAMGWALYNNAANSGDVDTALSVLNAMVGHQRSAAQALQATRILKKLSPETQLYGVQKSVNSLEEELKSKYKDKAPDIKINEELAKKFLDAKTQEERDEILKDIYRDIGRQMPSTWIDKWNAWRYLAMLGNFRTHVRNILGNAVFAPVVQAKNLTATAIESIVHGVTGKRTEKGKSFVSDFSKKDRALMKSAWGDYKNVADIVSGGGKYGDLANANKYIEEGRVIFKGLLKPLEWLRKGNSKLLDLEDAWFSQPHYTYALVQYCKAHGITAEQIANGKGLEAARQYAIKEAQKATYRDTNYFSQMVSEWGRSNRSKNPAKKAFGTVVEGILPFRKTPANILVRGVEYSPIGLLKGLTYDLNRVSKGEIKAYEAIDNISAGLTGTGLLALGAYLAAQGLIRGRGEDEEEEREFKELMGHQAYALELPNGTSITLDWLAPEALPFFVGVNLWEAVQNAGGEMNLSDIFDAIINITKPMLEMSCLQSLNDLFESVGYASSNEGSGIITILASAATSYLSQALPTLLGQAERTSEKERMTTYTEKNAFLTGDMQYTLGKWSAKIPGWDFNQIPYIDAWGRKESSENALARGLDNFLNPAYRSNIEMSDMEKELLRLYELTGDAAVLPERAAKYFTVDGKRVDLTAEQYVKYAMDKGKKSYNLITNLVNSKAYKNLDDSAKIEAIEKAFDYANQKAKDAVISEFEPDTWVETADSFGTNNVGEYLAYEAEISATRKDNNNKITKSQVETVIKNNASTENNAWKMYMDMYPTSETAKDAKDSGLSVYTYMQYAAGVDRAKGEKNNATKIQAYEVISNINASDDVKWALIELEHDSKGVQYAKENGISADTYLKFFKALDEVDKPTDTGKMGTYNGDEKDAALARLKGLSQPEKNILKKSMSQ